MGWQRSEVRAYVHVGGEEAGPENVVACERTKHSTLDKEGESGLGGGQVTVKDESAVASTRCRHARRRSSSPS